MQQTTGPYRLDMAQVVRGITLMRVTLGLIDTDAATTIFAREASPGIYYSTLDGLENETAAPAKTYATFEPGRMRLDGTQLIASSQGGKLQNEGYVSAELSGANCVYQAVPAVRFRFSKLHTVVGLSFVFDNSTKEYPRRVRLRAWREGAVIWDEQASPTSADWSITHALQRFDTVEIAFLESCVPMRRARLQQIMFGIGIQFESNRLTKTTRSDEVDPLTRKLPKEDFSFTVENTLGSYNPDAPKNIWQYLEKRSPIRVEYGHICRAGLSWGDLAEMKWSDIEETGWKEVYSGGARTWLDGGRYYLTGQPSTNDTSATFKGKSILSLGDTEYPYGLYRPEGISLYDLAMDVLHCAALPLIYDGEQPYKLWDGLKQIRTTAPLPVAPCRECLQLIAHAACCVLFTDRAGYLRMELTAEEQHALHLDFTTLCDIPSVSKLPPLKEVKTAYYKYGPKSEERRELLKTSFNVSGTATLQIEYSAATDVLVECVGGTATWCAYTYGMQLTLHGNGEVQVLVTGVELATAATYYYYKVDPPEETGEIETVKNPLITSYAAAKAVTLWTAAYLKNRSTYETDYRGNPEIDAGDKLFLQSRFETKFPARVLSSKIVFDGTLSGSLEVKKLEK